jgi:hypothetical protein
LIFASSAASAAARSGVIGMESVPGGRAV